MTGHDVDASDEQRHVPDSESLWNESVYADFVSADGAIGGYVRIGLYPNLGVTWWTAVVTGPGRETVTVATYDAPLPTVGFGSEWKVTDPLQSVALIWQGTGSARQDPTGIYRGEPGRNVDLAMDLTWATDGTPYHYEITTRYEIPCLVSGSVSIDGERFEIAGPGQRDHSWGVRDWWAMQWCWASARLNDGARLHTADIRLAGGSIALGYVQTPAVAPVQALVISESLGAEGLPTSARIDVDGLGMTVTPTGYGPLLLVADDGRQSRFPRAMARYQLDDGRTGLGWIEWNQVQD